MVKATGRPRFLKVHRIGWPRSLFMQVKAADDDDRYVWTLLVNTPGQAPAVKVSRSSNVCYEQADSLSLKGDQSFIGGFDRDYFASKLGKNFLE